MINGMAKLGFSLGITIIAASVGKVARFIVSFEELSSSFGAEFPIGC
jgi:hypothetical protein